MTVQTLKNPLYIHSHFLFQVQQIKSSHFLSFPPNSNPFGYSPLTSFNHFEPFFLFFGFRTIKIKPEQNQDSNDMSREDHHSDTESGNYSGPLSGPLNKRTGRKSARFNIEDSSSSKQEQYVEITLDVRDDSVAVHSVKPANGQEEDQEMALLARGLEKRPASSIVRNASAKIRQVSHEIKRLASSSRKPQLSRLDRTKSAAAHALKGLKFISKTDGGSGWAAVEKRFDEITASTNGLLPRSRFCECIGKYAKYVDSFSLCKNF